MLVAVRLQHIQQRTRLCCTASIPYKKAPDLMDETAITLWWFIVIFREKVFLLKISKVLEFCAMHILVSKEESKEHYRLVVKSVKRTEVFPR
jgi:hypothetical protein